MPFHVTLCVCTNVYVCTCVWICMILLHGIPHLTWLPNGIILESWARIWSEIWFHIATHTSHTQIQANWRINLMASSSSSCCCCGSSFFDVDGSLYKALKVVLDIQQMCKSMNEHHFYCSPSKLQFT